MTAVVMATLVAESSGVDRQYRSHPTDARHARRTLGVLSQAHNEIRKRGSFGGKDIPPHRQRS